jgi:hypothetical protein
MNQTDTNLTDTNLTDTNQTDINQTDTNQTEIIHHMEEMIIITIIITIEILQDEEYRI